MSRAFHRWTFAAAWLLASLPGCKHCGTRPAPAPVPAAPCPTCGVPGAAPAPGAFPGPGAIPAPNPPLPTTAPGAPVPVAPEIRRYEPPTTAPSEAAWRPAPQQGVYLNVPQQYSQAAKPGILADLVLQEFPGRRFQGKLVRTADAIDQASRTLLVEVDVDNASGELFPGAYAEVHLKVPQGTPALILPVSALIFRGDSLQVGTVQNDPNDKNAKATLVSVTLGHDMGDQVEVVAGLQPEDSVITNPPDSLISGETVRVVTSNGNAPSTAAGAASE